MYVDLQQFAAVLLPLESAIFYPNGNSPGNTMENSVKQNPKTGFKPPQAEMPTSKWLFLKNLRSKTLGQIQNLVPHRLTPRLKSKTTSGDTL